MDRIELADFLRRARARLSPSDVGLNAGPRRRTPGLRREEVAQLAGMSADYYTRLEQRRGSHPSRQMLVALARALRLTDVERDHLFHLAGDEPPRPGGSSDHIRPGLLLILDRLHDLPASVMSDWGELLAQNAMSVALAGDHTGTNMIRRWFLVPGARDLAPPEKHEAHARAHVASLRAVTAARPDDPGPPWWPNSVLPQRNSRLCGSRTTSWSAAPRRRVSGTRWSAPSTSTARYCSATATASSSSCIRRSPARRRTNALNFCGSSASRTWPRLAALSSDHGFPAAQGIPPY